MRLHAFAPPGRGSGPALGAAVGRGAEVVAAGGAEAGDSCRSLAPPSPEPDGRQETEDRGGEPGRDDPRIVLCVGLPISMTGDAAAHSETNKALCRLVPRDVCVPGNRFLH